MFFSSYQGKILNIHSEVEKQVYQREYILFLSSVSHRFSFLICVILYLPRVNFSIAISLSLQNFLFKPLYGVWPCVNFVDFSEFGDYIKHYSINFPCCFLTKSVWFSPPEHIKSICDASEIPFIETRRELTKPNIKHGAQVRDES